MPILGIVNASKSNFRGVAGYFGGGYDTGNISGIDKVTFPADTKTTLSATITANVTSITGMANSGPL